MKSEPSSPRHETESGFDNRGHSADDKDLLDCVTTLTYRVTREVTTIVNADDPATTEPDDSQPSTRRRGRKRARS